MTTRRLVGRSALPLLALGCLASLNAIASATCVMGLPPPPPPPPSMVSCDEFDLVLSEVEGPAIQRQGDIMISLVPKPPRCTVQVAVNQEETEAPEGLSFMQKANLGGIHATYIIRTEQETLVPESTFDIVVTITNQSERVFRGEGMVYHYQVGSLDVPLVQDNYAEVDSMLLLPGQAADRSLTRLPRDSIQDGSIVRVSFYDVIVERDEAGNPLVLGNFTWFFQARFRTVERMMPAESCYSHFQTTPAESRALRDYTALPEVVARDPFACANPDRFFSRPR